MSFLPEDVPGLRALPSFGLGAFVASLVNLVIVAMVREGGWRGICLHPDAGGASAAETDVSATTIVKGSVVEYQTTSGVDEWETASVLVVGHDDELRPYYQIQVAGRDGGQREKQTVPERLRIPPSRQDGSGTSWCAPAVAVG